MDALSHVADNQALLLGLVALLGLLVGSFLNVVAHRLPLMLQRRWRAECEEFLELPPSSAQAQAEAFNLWRPASACPHCGHRIRPWENLPVLSYLILRGRCSACATAISPQYPLVEATSGLLSLAVAWQLGPGWPLVGALLLTWSMIALAIIDLRHTLLPDSITLSVLWLGLLLNTRGTFVDLESAVIGAAAGYLTLWGVYQLFKLVTGKEGMGYGDFKLLALFGAWFGWQMLPLIVLLSSMVGALVGLSLILFRGRDRARPLPFGPYLAAAGWIAMLWGDVIVQTYLGYSGL